MLARIFMQGRLVGEVDIGDAVIGPDGSMRPPAVNDEVAVLFVDSGTSGDRRPTLAVQAKIEEL